MSEYEIRNCLAKNYRNILMLTNVIPQYHSAFSVLLLYYRMNNTFGGF